MKSCFGDPKYLGTFAVPQEYDILKFQKWFTCYFIGAPHDGRAVVNEIADRVEPNEQVKVYCHPCAADTLCSHEAALSTVCDMRGVTLGAAAMKLVAMWFRERYDAECERAHTDDERQICTERWSGHYYVPTFQGKSGMIPGVVMSPHGMGFAVYTCVGIPGRSPGNARILSLVPQRE